MTAAAKQPGNWTAFAGGPCPLPAGTICDLIFDVGPPEFDVPVGLPDPDYPDLGCASWTRSHRIDPDLKIIPWVIAYRIIPTVIRPIHGVLRQQTHDVCQQRDREAVEGLDPNRAARAAVFAAWLEEAATAPAFVRRELINPPSKIRPREAGEVASKAEGRVETEGAPVLPLSISPEIAMAELRDLLLAHHQRILQIKERERDVFSRALACDIPAAQRAHLHKLIRQLTGDIERRKALIVAAEANLDTGFGDE